jgi:hypothetical protein
MNQAFGTFDPKNKQTLTSSDSEIPIYGVGTTGGTFKAVMQGACSQETEYTVYTYFGENAFRKNNIVSLMKPGDVLCDQGGGEGNRHVMIYMGYDDLNGDGVAGKEDRIYFLHSSGTGILIYSTSANSSNLDRYRSFYTYK